MDNKKICQLLGTHFDRFYDNIGVEIKLFRRENWNFMQVIADNEDVLFYNEQFMSDTNKLKFCLVFPKYISLVKQNFLTTSNLFVFLNNLHISDKTNYLKNIMIDKKFCLISPSYIMELYVHYLTLYKRQHHVIQRKMEAKLLNILKCTMTNIYQFADQYELLVDVYVREFPITKQSIDDHKNNFLHNVFDMILNFIDKLVDLNIYAIHPIIDNVTSFHMPFDVMNLNDFVII